MSILPCIALFKRHIIIIKRDSGKIADLIYWPIFDIIIWGYAGRWVDASTTQTHFIAITILTALILWQTLWRSFIEVSMSLLEEIFARNIVSLWTSPLRLSQWTATAMFLGLFKNIFTFSFACLAAWFLCKVNILSAGPILIIWIINLLIAGWWLGFLAASALLRWGRSIYALTWAIGWVLAPFSGVFYPTTMLAPFLQYISAILPTTYTFLHVRATLNGQTPMPHALEISFILNAIYFVGALLLFRYSFMQSKKQGLARLESEA